MRALSIFLLLTPAIAHAYLDPGAGSMLLQGLIGALAAGMGFASLYWHRLKSWFSRNKSEEDTEEEKDDNAETKNEDDPRA